MKCLTSTHVRSAARREERLQTKAARHVHKQETATSTNIRGASTAVRGDLWVHLERLLVIGSDDVGVASCRWWGSGAFLAAREGGHRLSPRGALVVVLQLVQRDAQHLAQLLLSLDHRTKI